MTQMVTDVTDDRARAVLLVKKKMLPPRVFLIFVW